MAVKEPQVSDSTTPAKASNQVEAEHCSTVQQSKPVQNTTQARLGELGIHGPFPKSTRRPKRPFSATDDKNLLIGFEKHGPVWHNIRDDPDLGFTTRQPTDLRDRFRIKYADLYAKAGYKLKPKEERVLSSQTTKSVEQDQRRPQEQSKTPSSETTKPSLHVTYRGGPDTQLTPSTDRPSSNSHPTTTTSATPSSSLKSYLPFHFDSTLLGDDVLSEDGDGDGSESPITLNRNILQWADANPSTLSTFPPQQQTYSNYSTAAVDTSMNANLFGTHDGIHINPLATIKLPPATMYTSSASLVTNAPTSSSTAVPNTGLGTGLSGATPGDMRMSVGTSSTANIATSVPTSAYPRTPNLPTIVFPHVPAASARSAMHNLPTPADLLLGIDLERTEAGFTLDDALGLGMP